MFLSVSDVTHVSNKTTNENKNTYSVTAGCCDSVTIDSEVYSIAARWDGREQKEALFFFLGG
jgi:hypothetical protein